MRDELEQVLAYRIKAAVHGNADQECSFCDARAREFTTDVINYVSGWLMRNGKWDVSTDWRLDHARAGNAGAGGHSGGGPGDLWGGQGATGHETVGLGGAGAEAPGRGDEGDSAGPEPARQVLIDTTIDGFRLSVSRRRIGEEYGWGTWNHEWDLEGGLMLEDGEHELSYFLNGLSDKAVLRLVEMIRVVYEQPQ